MRHLKHRSYKYRTGPLNIIMPRASTFQSWTTLVNGVYIVDDCFTCSFSAIEVRKLVQCWVGFIFTISILLAYTTFGRGLPNELKNLGASLWLEFVKQYEHHTVQRKKPISSACLGFFRSWTPFEIHPCFFQVEGKQKGNKASGFRVFGSRRWAVWKPSELGTRNASPQRHQVDWKLKEALSWEKGVFTVDNVKITQSLC